MEERAPPPPPPPLPGPQGATAAAVPPSRTAGTYVVQVPKDQIYRVPPPENAYLVERYRSRKKNKKDASPCLSYALRLLVVLAIVIALLGIIALVIYLIVRPGLPLFTVKDFVVKNYTSRDQNRRSRPSYAITMKADNPSARMSFAYGSGGKAVLSHRNEDIATAEPPEFYQGYNDETTLRLDLRGSSSALPKEIERSLKGSSKEVIPFSLSLKFPVRLKIGTMTMWPTRLDVECNIKTSALSKGTEVAPQKCTVKLRS